MKTFGALVSAVLLSTSAFADAPSIFAIRGGTVHRVSGAPISGGTVIVRDGLIAAVGTNVTIPPEATVIDATGMHVYPGLFDAQTTLGLPAPAPPARTRGEAPRPATDQPKLTAASRVVDRADMSADDRLAKRTTGVTTVLIAPSGEVFSGQSAIINLGDAELNASVIRSPAALHVAYVTKSWGVFPDSLMGAFAHIRQTFLDARHHEAARGAYEKSPAGRERPVNNAELEALAPALARRLPVIITADSAEMIARTLRLSDELGARVVISGARGGHDIAERLAARKADVFVSVDWPKANAVVSEEEPLRLIRYRLNAPATPARLAGAGVRFALVSAGGGAGDYIAGIRKAIRSGLSPEAALRAVTLSPAEILGVDRQIGSIDRGKIANLVVTDKPIFDEERSIKHLFIDGRLTSLQREEPKEGDSDAPIVGTWNLQVRMHNDTIAIQVTFSGTPSNLTGSYSGDRGAGELSRVTSGEGRVTFSFAEKTTESGENTEWRFEGTVEGNEMTGTVTTTIGTFQFSGSRPE